MCLTTLGCKFFAEGSEVDVEMTSSCYFREETLGGGVLGLLVSSPPLDMNPMTKYLVKKAMLMMLKAMQDWGVCGLANARGWNLEMASDSSALHFPYQTSSKFYNTCCLPGQTARNSTVSVLIGTPSLPTPSGSGSPAPAPLHAASPPRRPVLTRATWTGTLWWRSTRRGS